MSTRIIESCFHCGLDIPNNGAIIFSDKSFCCNGCKTVFSIFQQNGLTEYYAIESAPGATPLEAHGKYDFLDNEEIVEKLLEFNEANIRIVSLNIPHIHCSSCIWILENLNKLHSGISTSTVNFPAKTLRITYNPETTTLKDIVLMLGSVGYEPYLTLQDYQSDSKPVDHSLTYKLGVAFFCFGNIMLLSFPEYFEVGEFWLEQYKNFFRWLIFGLALPSFLYSASGYYIAAWHAVKSRHLNIEIPIALGIVVMFVRSTVDIVFDLGPGFFDSLTGLVFFMLLGKMFQMKTYSFLSFERDYKSYFPVAVTRLLPGRGEENIPVHEIRKGDRLLIRNQELIPADGILISDNASIDYSFVSGESVPVTKKSGDKVFAGGRQLGKVIETEVLSSVSQSYLTQLWSNDVFQKKVDQQHKTITDKISRYFTPVLLLIAFAGFGFWIPSDTGTAFNVFTAVLIVACPCALALTAPFTMGNVLRIFGRAKFYLKNALVIEQLAKVDTIVFDKTGTITTAKKSNISWHGTQLDVGSIALLRNVLRGSNHPLSRMLYDHLPETELLQQERFEEITGSGIKASIRGTEIRIGAASFVGGNREEHHLLTAVHISIGGNYLGKYVFHNAYRTGLRSLFAKLKHQYQVVVLSGDNEGERETLEMLIPGVRLVFNQKPEQKLEFIKGLQDQGRNVMMVGDGLNDAGALAQSNVGIAISENVNVFSPACDAILDAGEFHKLTDFLTISKKAISTIKMSFGLSLLYNVVGLAFALTGNLLPLIAAIIMPLSTVTIISFVTVLSNYNGRRLYKKGPVNEGSPQA